MENLRNQKWETSYKKQHQRVILFYDKFEAILCVFRAMSAASEFYETELHVFRVPGVFLFVVISVLGILIQIVL